MGLAATALALVPGASATDPNGCTLFVPNPEHPDDTIVCFKDRPYIPEGKECYNLYLAPPDPLPYEPLGPVCRAWLVAM